jgi:hypothetical protein
MAFCQAVGKNNSKDFPLAQRVNAMLGIVWNKNVNLGKF